MKRNLWVYGLEVCYLVFFRFSIFLPPSSMRVDASSSLWQHYTYNGTAGRLPSFVYTPESYRVGAAVPLIVYVAGFIAGAAMALLLFRACCKPLINMWPRKLQRTTARHHANMASFHLQQELILATDFRHDALRLARRRDVIG
jgi:hypothetical protein